jgi:galactose mutarotase-like enzyme
MSTGANVYILESSLLKVAILPDNGGKLASIKCQRTQTEFLLPGSLYERIAEFGPFAHFHESDCAGWDECLPTVSPCGPEGTMGAVPDHGDFWRFPWQVVSNDTSNEISLQANGFSMPLCFRKHISLKQNDLTIRYEIENTGNAPVEILYASHPLFCIDAKDTIVLPNEITDLTLLESRGNRIGSPEATVSWPIHRYEGSTFDLRTTGQMSDRTAEMLYSNRLTRGVAGLYRNLSGHGVVLRFDTAAIPYLGLWLCYGGWPDDDRSSSLQHAIALEPTTAPYGSLRDAVRASQARRVEVGEVFSFSLRLLITGCEEPMTEQQFQELCAACP